MSPNSDTDPYYSSVVFLTDFDTGAAVDVKGHTITLTNGAAVTSSNAEPNGTYSLALDGTDDYATSPDSADWDFGTGDFTLEFDVYHDDFTAAAAGGGSNQCALSRSLSAWGILVSPGVSGGNLIWRTGAGGELGTTSNKMTVQAWNHVAVSRVSGTLRIFINGVKGLEISETTSHDYATALVLGASDEAPYGLLDGNVGNYRITKGVGRYTTDFTVPDRPYPRA